MGTTIDIVSISDHPLVGALVSEVVREVAPEAQLKAFDNFEAFEQSDLAATVLLAGVGRNDLATFTALSEQGRFEFGLAHSLAYLPAGTRPLSEPDSMSIVWLPRETSVRDFYAHTVKLLRFAELISAPAGAHTPKNQFQSNISTESGTKPLTLRQVEVLELLATGLSAKEVAKKLSISPETVRGHVKDVFVRLGVKNIAQAIEVYSKARRFSSMVDNN